jgi:hypothetical protein
MAFLGGAAALRTEAHLSPDRRYRYWLIRVWDEALPLFCVIGVNPSKADEQEDDPTIRKTIGFGKKLGYGGVLMLNVGAYRATDPRDWKRAADPFGPENSIPHLKKYLASFAPIVVIAAWGKNCVNHRAPLRALEVMKEIPNLQCWGRNIDGTPRHPARISYATPLEPLEAPQLGGSTPAIDHKNSKKRMVG